MTNTTPATTRRLGAYATREQAIHELIVRPYISVQDDAAHFTPERIENIAAQLIEGDDEIGYRFDHTHALWPVICAFGPTTRGNLWAVREYEGEVLICLDAPTPTGLRPLSVQTIPDASAQTLAAHGWEYVDATSGRVQRITI